MEWFKGKPVTTGYYAWKEQQSNAGLLVNRRLAKVIKLEGKLMIDFNRDGCIVYVEVDKIAVRNWIKVGELDE